MARTLGTTRVPVGPISDALNEYLDSSEELSMPDFAEQIGVNYTTIYNVAHKVNSRVEFSIADTILCKIGRPQLWCSAELHDAYLAVDLTKYEDWELELLNAELPLAA